MNEIKRYSFYANSYNEATNGHFVMYKDYLIEIVDLKKENERLKEYANHKITCLIYRLNDPDEDCDCGLDDLLKDKE